MNTWLMKTLVLATSVASFSCFGADAVIDQFIREDRAPAGAPVELGVWNMDIDACIELSKEKGIPMIAVWSREGCAHCRILEQAIMSDVFRDWIKKSGLILGFSSSLDDGTRPGYGEGGVRQGTATVSPDTPTGYTGNGRYWKWCKGPENLSNYPEVRFFWYKDGKKIVDYAALGDTVDGQQGIYQNSYNKAGQKVIDYITQKSGFAPYLANPQTLSSYVGGKFALEESEDNRLEVESGTGTVSFEMVRDGNSVSAATNNLVKLIGPDGSTAQTVNVTWAAGQESQTVSVDMSKVAFTANGQKALLVAADADGTEQSTNTVTYVTGSGSSPANPLWIGERTATATRAASASVLQFGEWTMDLDVAKSKVAAANGNAYTLVAVVGSLWCHDCANTERNFTSVTDSSGNNKLIAWAKKNNVALVSIDIPNFTNNTIDCASPTLLSRSAYTTTLAYELPEYGMYDVTRGGAPMSLTNPAKRSGLGYLTRKGVSDEEALGVLARNYDLVSKDVADGGLHSAVDSRSYRTGVPIFVLLDKSGKARARFTRYQSVSPMTADKAQWDNIIKRFDEMLAMAGGTHADGGVLENDYPSAKIAGFKANGGSASGEISHCDFQDVYRLDEFGGNAILKMSVKGGTDADIAVSFLSLDASGKKKTVATATGSLKSGVDLSYEFASADQYYVEVAGAGYDAAFSPANATAEAFYSYTATSSIVLVPGDVRSTASAPSGSDEVTMRLQDGERYRIEGLAAAPGAALVPDGGKYYVAAADGDAVLKVATKGGAITYQLWNPGSIGFTAKAKTVTEGAGDVSVGITRSTGTSGALKLRVTLDADNTTLYDGDGRAKFQFEDASITLPEGWMGHTNVVITVLDDSRYDGSGAVALSLAVEDEGGDTEIGNTSFVLTVNEDDKQSAGKVAFTGASPFFSRKLTVYARASEGATIYAERIEASDGYVTAKVGADVSGVSILVDGAATKTLAWPNHVYGPREVKVKGIEAGKTAKITLGSPTDGLKVLSASNTVTVVSIADNAPAFEKDADSVTISRYVECSSAYPVVLADGVVGATLSFEKVSGSLPAGLKASYDSATQSLVISGAATGKAGVYSAVYQVTQKVGTAKTPGMTLSLTVTVKDPTSAEDAGGCNAYVAAASSRTIKDIPVLNRDSNRLAGLLQVTLPKTGKVSAKYTCSEGVVTFSAKGWSGYDESTKALSAQLASPKAGYSIDMTVSGAGLITARITDPAAGKNAEVVATSSGKTWSADDNAAAWSGYYTVSLVNDAVKTAEGYEWVAPRGNGYLTLKMTSASAINSGTVTWAGTLPNGTAISGSAVIDADDSCGGNARLPIYSRSSTDVIAAIIDMCTTTQEDSDIDAHWVHKDKYEDLSYDVEFDIYGGVYNSATNLEALAVEGYGSSQLALSFDIDGLLGTTIAGTPIPVDPVAAAIGEKNITVAKDNAANATLAFDRSTGVVSGTFKFKCDDGTGAKTTYTASYRGVVLFGWGLGCGCGDESLDKPQPFVSGGYWISDKVNVQGGSGNRTVTFKRGGAVAIQ